MDTETKPDRAYKWTMRALYTFAIGLNVWYAVESYRDTPEAQRVIGQFERVATKVSHPWRHAKWLRHEETATVLEAWNIVEQASKGE